MVEKMSKCAYCKYTDGVVYTSMPPKYKCTITGEYHLALDDCNVEFVPVKHGKWIWKDHYLVCSECGKENDRKNYCPNCGSDMRGGEDE